MIFLKNMKIREISILTDDKKPANGESVIVKNDKGTEIFCKCDSCIEGLLHVTVMKANVPDSDDEVAEPKDIRKAAHDFMREKQLTIDTNHNHVALPDVFIAESYIEKSTGDWKAVFDISGSKELMEKAEKGLINGVSIFGSGERIEKANMFETMKKWALSTFISKDYDSKIENDNVNRKVWRLNDALSEILDSDSTDKVKLMIESIDQFKNDIVNNDNVKKEDKTMQKDAIIKMLKDEYGLEVVKKEEAPQADKPADKSPLAELEKQLNEQKKLIETLMKQRETGTTDDLENANFATLMDKAPAVLEKMEKENPSKYKKLYNDYVGGK